MRFAQIYQLQLVWLKNGLKISTQDMGTPVSMIITLTSIFHRVLIVFKLLIFVNYLIKIQMVKKWHSFLSIIQQKFLV